MPDPDGLLERESARAAWRFESELNSWLLGDEQLARLGRETGFDLTTLGTEARVAKGRADIVCVDSISGGIVVIETQMGVSDLDHAGRLLKYASEYAATGAVLIAERFPDLIVDAFSDNGQRDRVTSMVRLVEVRAYRAEDGSVQASLEKIPLAGPRAGSSEEKRGATPTNVLLDVPSEENLASIVGETLGAAKGSDSPLSFGRGSLNGIDGDGPILVSLWRPTTDESLVNTMHAARTRMSKRIMLVVSKIDADARDKIATLRDWIDQPLDLLVLRRTRSGDRVLRPVDLSRVLAGSPALKFRKARMEFWEDVAAIVALGSKTSMRKDRAVGKSSHSIVYSLGMLGVRLAALHQVRLRRLSVEVRVHHANEAVAANRYAQLKDEAREIEEALAPDFEVAWLGATARKGEQVLRLAWRRTLLEGEPYANDGLAQDFAEAVLAAEAALVSHVRAMEDYRW